MSYTIAEFAQDYPDEESCLQYLFEAKYKNHCCSRCGHTHSYKKVKKRRCYQCTKCKKQVYPTANTVLHKTRIPINVWFYVIFLFCTSKDGVSAKYLERLLGVSYPTALKMGRKVRELMGKEDGDVLTGVVECDESWVGGKVSNMGALKKKKYRRKRKADKHYNNKIPVFGAVQRGGRAILVAMKRNDFNNVYPLMRMYVSASARVITDDAQVYKGVRGMYKIESINKYKGIYVNGDAHTNTIENLWSRLKRTIKGTHVSVSPEHLQSYLNEAAFGHNHRDDLYPTARLLIDRIC